MNEYVAGGWGATAGILALYTWRVLHRGRALRRALPDADRLPWSRRAPAGPGSPGAATDLPAGPTPEATGR